MNKVLQEYKHEEKMGFGKPLPPGPWMDEPDKVVWIDEATNLDCLIVRGPAGALCGYVGVAPEHPWHGKDYGECTNTPPCEESSYCPHSPAIMVDGAHGGLTFADACRPSPKGEAYGICHVEQPGRPKHVWWFGFDCAHAYDLCPADRTNPAREFLEGTGFDETYRDIEYVKGRVTLMAAELAAIA